MFERAATAQLFRQAAGKAVEAMLSGELRQTLQGRSGFGILQFPATPSDF